jgi:hypothetical protein
MASLPTPPSAPSADTTCRRWFPPTPADLQVDQIEWELLEMPTCRELIRKYPIPLLAMFAQRYDDKSSSSVKRIDLVIIAWTSLRAKWQSLLVCGKSLALRDMISCRDFAISLTARRPRISLPGAIASRKDLRNR